MKIIITGASTYGVKNLGDDAMLKVLCDEIKKKIPKSQLVFLARHPDPQFDKAFGIKSIKNIDHNSKTESIGKWFFGFNPDDSTDHLAKIRKFFETADLVIIGGNSFMEISPNQFLRGVSSYSSFFAIMSKFYETPFALYGVNGHPLENDITKENAKFLCNNASVCTIREEFFKKELIKSGVNSKKLKVFSDPAFGIEPIQNKVEGLKILKKENIIPKSPNLVGICFRHAYWSWDDKKFKKYVKLMAKICDYIVDTMNSDIIFLSNCTYSQSHKFQDDRIVSRYIKNYMKSKSNAHIIKTELLLPEMLSIYPLLDFVITNRRHVSIFAAIHGKPFLSLSTGTLWHFKPFLELLSKKLLIDLEKSNFNSIKSKIDFVSKNSDTISNSLRKQIPPLQKQARKQVHEIIKSFDKNS